MVDVVAYALFCGFALSALLVPATTLAMRRAAKLSGETRHLIWFMVLLATAGATVAAFAVSALRPGPDLSATVLSTAAPAPSAGHAAVIPFAALVTIVLACWLVVAIAQTVRIARRVIALRAMKRRATAVAFDGRLPRGARTVSSEYGIPAAVGYLHPAILLPSDTIAGLDPGDARQIVLHEAAHLRRCDDLTGLVFHLCAAAFWFNPFVHYIGKQLSLECEIACDEMVVEQTGDATRYATLLLEMAEIMTTRNPQLAWHAFARANGLVMRVHNLLLRGGHRRPALPRPALAALIAIFLSSAGLAAFNAPALARSQGDASTRVSQAVRVYAAEETQETTRSSQRLNTLVCKAQRVRNDGRFYAAGTWVCDEAAMKGVKPMHLKRVMQFTPAMKVTGLTRIKKAGATP